MNALKFCKKLLVTFCMFAVFAVYFSKSAQAQVTETFETSTPGSATFTTSGKTFNLTNNLGTSAPLGFKVFNLSGTGYNSSNQYIQAEDGAGPQTMGQTGTIKAATGIFKLNNLYIYLTGSSAQLPGVTFDNLPGSVTFRGKLGGATQFTVVKNTTGTNNGYGLPGNGFTYIDLAIEGGANNSNTNIDELEIQLSNNYDYFAIDNFNFNADPCVAPAITGNPPNRTICNGGTTTFTASATGATAYQWQVSTNGGTNYTDLTNVAPYTNVTTTTLSISAATSAMTGYRYRLRAENGVASCFTNTSTGGLLTVDVVALTPSQTNVACNGGNTGAASVTPTSGIGPYTYLWSNGATTSAITSLVAGTYSVTVTDNISCTATSSFTITQPPVLNGSTVVTNIACFGSNTGAINLTPSGGTPGYTFVWNDGVTTEDRIGLVAGTYSVTITDANSCTRTLNNISVTQPTAAVSGTTVVTNVACFGGNTGAINLTPTGGTGPYTFNWGGGVTTEDRTILAAGTYSVTITDVNGCTGTVSGITVTQPNVINGTATVTNVACNGGTTGSIDLTPSGGTPGYTYNWGGGITSQDRTGLAAGTYSVTITDANACTAIKSFTITQPAAISGTTVVTNVACFGGNTGAINLTPTGGVGPYTFNWGGGVSTEDRTILAAGTYSVTITDANGCTGTVSGITVTQPAAAVSGTTVVTNVYCFNGSNGSINLTPTGGVGPYTFNWGGGITTEDRTSLIAGTYSVTITDANGCTGTVSGITVTQPTAIVSGTTVVTNVACFGGNTGAINLTPTGGTGPYTFNWGGGVTTEDRTGLIAGTYSVTITDVNGCTGTVSGITVTQSTALSVVPASQTNIACFGGSNGAASINTPTGGAGGYTYNWSPGTPIGDGTTAISGLAAGTYTVTVTDVNGCTRAQSFTITQPNATLTATSGGQTNVSCFGGTNGSATVSVSGGTPSYTYAWSPSGGTAATASGLSVGTYTVTVTDANGCTTTQSFTITEPNGVALASASLTAATVSVPYSYTFTATGGSGTYSYVNIGVIPPGMSLTTGGVLSGTPSLAGSYAFSIKATDQGSCGQSVTTSYTLSINLGVQTITFASLANVAFGDGAITLAATSSAGLPVSYASSNQNVATISGNTLTIAGAGSTTITASQAGNGSYLPATAVTQTLTVLPKSITGTFSVASKEFDGTTTANIQTRSLLGVVIADQADVNLVGGVATFASANVGSAIAVTQTGMSLSGSKASNYSLQNVASTTSDINPKEVTVTADSKVKTYGDADPALTYTATGLIGGDLLMGSLSRSAGNGVGSYAITASGLNAGNNYSLNFVGGTLSINKKVLTVTADNKNRSFNTANPTLTVSYLGFANGETSTVLSSPAIASTTAVISSPAGNYPIIASGAAAENYSFNYVNGILTIASNSQTISFAALADKLSTDGIFTLNATSSAGLTVSFSSSDASIARIVNGNQVEILKAGTVNITASQAGNGNFAAATPVVQSLKITDNPAPVIAITSSRGNSFNKGESTTLTATGAVSYVWSNGNGIISGQNTDKLTVRPSANSVYTVTGSNQFGRTSTQSISITVVENLAVVEIVPGTNLLSPDGDGVNDYFVVKNIDLYPNNTVTIYDMTGKTLYKTRSYKNDWDGSINGNPLQTGSYYYIIEFGNGKTSAKKGFITIIKQ